MRKQYIILVLLLFVALTASAKKVKVTIEGYNIDWNTDVRVIVNENIDEFHHADIKEGRFSITLKVEKGAFIRLALYKTEPMTNGARRVIRDFSKDSRQGMVVVAEGGKVRINYQNNNVKGSTLSRKLQERRHILQDIDKQIRELQEYPRGLHLTREQIEAREREVVKLREAQQQFLDRFIKEDASTPLPAWYMRNYPIAAEGAACKQAVQQKAAWLKHPILADFDK